MASIQMEQDCCTEEPPRSLDRIADMSSSAERAARSLQRFLGRFHGNPPPPPMSVASLKPAVPPGYANQLDRLEKALEELGGLLDKLDSIG